MRAKKGDRDAFSELAERHRRLVFHVALSVLGGYRVVEAEDVVQMTLLKAFEGLGRLRETEGFAVWLARIARNEAVTMASRGRYRRVHVGESVLEAMPAEGESGFDRVSGEQRRAILEACLERMPEVYRELIRLHYWLEWPVGQISAVMGLPEGTVKSYLYRARKGLKQSLEEQGYDAE